MAKEELRDFRNHFGSTRNPFESYPWQTQQYQDMECPGCPRGFVLKGPRELGKGKCVPYVMHDPTTWSGSTRYGCSPGWTSKRVDLVSGDLLNPEKDPYHREREAMICIPVVSTNFGRRPDPSNP